MKEYNNQVKRLNSKLEEIKRKNKTNTEGLNKVCIERVKRFLPNIDFRYHSLERILSMVQNENMILEKLYRLNKDPKKMKSEGVENTVVWHEIHFHTGQKNDGRLYYNHLSNGTFRVYAGLKKSQKYDIQKLKKNNEDNKYPD